jgi:hypothetical protein
VKVTLNSLEYLDPAGRCEQIGRIWEDFPQLVIDRFDDLWNQNGTYKEWGTSRSESFRTAAQPALPHPTHLGWEHEIFEVCFQEVLADLRTELWKRGEPFGDAMVFAENIAVPSVRMDVAFELSRISRPSLPRPRDTVDSITEPQSLKGESAFDGWTRIGHYEKEILNQSFEEGTTIERQIACSGIVATDNINELENVRMPMARVSESLLWKNADVRYRSAFGKLSGGLIVGYFYYGPATHEFALACHPVLVAGLRLSEGSWPGPLKMFDGNGEAAVVLRTWKTDAVRADIVGHIYRLVGCDLLLRTDMFDAICKAFESKVVMVTRENKG